ncbi:MAG: hypothetical protein IK083_02030 [Abditibacteriota bacterium]|nr:hypothetical protein [Abditibacteriota bacterium]
MEIIPGMDIINGQVVCAENIDWAGNGPIDHDPVNVARYWKSQGARHLYISDLEGARYGKPMHLDIVANIIKNVNIKVYLGGGIRNADAAARAFDAGIEKAVIGTYAALENDFAKYMFDTYKGRIIVSLANMNGYVSIHDWTARTEETVYEFAGRMEKMGAGTIVYNDVNRKGAHGGINLHTIQRMLSSTALPIIIGCGISDIDDIRELKKFGDRISGAVMVSALYKNLISYKDAAAAAKEV